MLLSIMTISERSARQRCPANAKHGARLKAMKSMHEVSFLHYHQYREQKLCQVKAFFSLARESES